jgi:hypothetical protein
MLISALAALLVSFVVACGAEAVATETPTPTPVVDPRLVLRDAGSNILELQSAAFTLEHQKGTTALIPGFLEMRKVSGVVDIPDRFKLTVEAESSAPRSFLEIRVVVIEDQAYLSDPGTGRWSRVPVESLPFSFANLGRSLAGIIEAVDGPVLIGVERLEGRETHRIRGLIKSHGLSSIVPGAGPDFDVELDLWVEQVENLLLQVRISGRVVPTDIPDAVRLLTLDDINVPVDITPPE